MSLLRGLSAGLGFVLLLSSADTASCADETVTLGAAVSLTGKYAQNGANTKNGYDLAVRRINDKGGIKIGGRPYRLEIRYYDDESTPARGHRTRRAAHPARRREVSTWAVRLRADPGHSADHRASQDPDGRGERRGAGPVHQGLSLHLRRAVDLRSVSDAGHRSCRCERGQARQDTARLAACHRHRERSVRAGRSRRSFLPTRNVTASIA